MEKKIYQCLIASPGDVIEERIICEKVIREINNSIGQRFEFVLEYLKWEDNTRPSFGEYSQGEINKQFGTIYDLFIGIMFKKYGTPTKYAGSGTEEEFNLAYERFINKEKIEIMFYFNNQEVKLDEINTDELSKINAFKKKIADLGAYYWQYNGHKNFEDKFREHLTAHFLKLYEKTNHTESKIKVDKKQELSKLFKERLDNALCMFSSQPIIWIEPTLSRSNEISHNPDENFNKRKKISELIENPESIIIKAPPQFGLTSLSHYLVNEAWINGSLWIYLDSEKLKPHTIHNAITNEVKILNMQLADVKCIILDSWNCNVTNSLKKLKNLSEANLDIPIIVMETIDDSKFTSEPDNVDIARHFDVLHLLALPRTQIRKYVSKYNIAREIGDEDLLLTKVINDLEVLNIHRTAFNCLTLLKVSERNFDDSPINRTNMLEMVLSILFNLDSLPTYDTVPDLKDCEYVLGRFCEKMITNANYEFSKEYFLEELRNYCKEKLIDLEIDIVFDILISNNIIIKREVDYIFRFSYWIFYFGAKRMHSNTEFAEHIFKSKKYIIFPEIIEFYTGIDRSRTDALEILLNDVRDSCTLVNSKVGLPENMNPYNHFEWKPTQQQIEKVQNELSVSVINSGLPESLKDQYADRYYNQIRPYNQSISAFFDEYSLHNLMQNIKAASRALRNSDYVEPNIKREMLKEIVRSWEQISKVLLALSPVLAAKGSAEFEGQAFCLANDFGSSFEERFNTVIQVIMTNVIAIFKDDLASRKIGPLLFDHFQQEVNIFRKHHLALFFIFTRPKGWKKYIEEYIVSNSKNSFYLYDVVNALRARFAYDFASSDDTNQMSYLIRMGYAKHEFGEKKPGIHQINKISNQALPKREDGEA